DDLGKVAKPNDFYEAFRRGYRGILAQNLTAKMDGKALEFICVKNDHEVADSIRCHFVFRAAWQPALGQRHEFKFREGNYETESGLLKLSLESDPAITLLSKTDPDEALKSKSLIDLKPGDEERLRKAEASFTVKAASAIT